MYITIFSRGLKKMAIKTRVKTTFKNQIARGFNFEVRRIYSELFLIFCIFISIFATIMCYITYLIY